MALPRHAVSFQNVRHGFAQRKARLTKRALRGGDPRRAEDDFGYFPERAEKWTAPDVERVIDRREILSELCLTPPMSLFENETDITLMKFWGQQHARELTVIQIPAASLFADFKGVKMIELDDMMRLWRLCRPKHPDIFLTVASPVIRRRFGASRYGQRLETFRFEVDAGVLSGFGRAVALLPRNIHRRPIRLPETEPDTILCHKFL